MLVSKGRKFWDKTNKENYNLKLCMSFFLTCPCVTFAHQHGGFVSREWLAAKGLLDERTREITTFVTHRGLYRYKRLMLGVTSAPESTRKLLRMFCMVAREWLIWQMI